MRSERGWSFDHERVVFALSGEVTRTQFFAGHRIQAYVCPQRRAPYPMVDFFRGERRALSEATRGAGCEVLHAHRTYEFAAAAIESDVPHVIAPHDSPLTALHTCVAQYEAILAQASQDLPQCSPT
jgi:hypothetical protein